MPRAPPVTTAFLPPRSILFMRCVLVAAFTRVNPKPTNCARQPYNCPKADSPCPSESRADPRSDHRREQPYAVAAGVHDRRRGSTPSPTEFDRRGPKRAFTKSKDSKGERKPKHDPERLFCEDAEQQQHRAASHPNAWNERPPRGWTERSLHRVCKPAAERHADRHREVWQTSVKAALGFPHAQHFVEIIMHPVKEEILEVTDGRVAQCQQDQASVMKKTCKARR